MFQRLLPTRHALRAPLIVALGLWLVMGLLMHLAWQRYSALRAQTQALSNQLDAQRYAVQQLSENWRITQDNAAALAALRAQQALQPLAKQPALDQLEASLQQPGISVTSYRLAAEASVKDPALGGLQAHQLMRHRISLEGRARHEAWLVDFIEHLAAHQVMGLSTVEFCAVRRLEPRPEALTDNPAKDEAASLPLAWHCTLDWYRFAPVAAPAEASP